MHFLLVLALLPAPAAAEEKSFAMAYEGFGSNTKIHGKHTAEWTNWLTICDPVRMETLQHGGMSQEAGVMASTIDSMWTEAFGSLASAGNLNCYGDAKSYSAELKNTLKNMRDEVMPAIRAETCERDALTAEERLAQMRAGHAKISAHEKTLQAALGRLDTFLRSLAPKNKNVAKQAEEWSEQEKCSVNTEVSLWLARVAVNKVSCEMYFAKLRLGAVAAREERGLASSSPCVSNRPKARDAEQLYEESGGELLGPRPEVSDITGTE